MVTPEERGLEVSLLAVLFYFFTNIYYIVNKNVFYFVKNYRDKQTLALKFSTISCLKSITNQF